MNSSSKHASTSSIREQEQQQQEQQQQQQTTTEPVFNLYQSSLNLAGCVLSLFVFAALAVVANLFYDWVATASLSKTAAHVWYTGMELTDIGGMLCFFACAYVVGVCLTVYLAASNLSDIWEHALKPHLATHEWFTTLSKCATNVCHAAHPIVQSIGNGVYCVGVCFWAVWCLVCHVFSIQIITHPHTEKKLMQKKCA